MFLKHSFTFGSATPFISVLQMVTSRTKLHVDFKNPNMRLHSMPTCRMMMINVEVLPKVTQCLKVLRQMEFFCIAV